MQLVKGGLFYSWCKHTMPLTNMCSNWMLISSSGQEITFIHSLIRSLFTAILYLTSRGVIINPNFVDPIITSRDVITNFM